MGTTLQNKTSKYTAVYSMLPSVSIVSLWVYSACFLQVFVIRHVYASLNTMASKSHSLLQGNINEDAEEVPTQ